MGDQHAVQKFDGSMALTPLSPAQAIERHEMLVAFVKRSLVQGRDYGIIPGTDKRSLWKPGAEKLCTLFGYSVRLTPTQTEQDWTGKEHNGEPFFFYEHKCEIMHGGVFVVEAYGSCNSFEKKYRLREGKRVCPKCQKESIFRSKPRENDPPDKVMGWYCWTKKGGCGATFSGNDPAITSQKVGMVKNDEIFDQVNTMLKMSQKRAMVGATVIACNASEFFSGEFDSEGYDEDAMDITPLVVVESTSVIEAKASAASKQLYGDETDLVAEASKPTDLGPQWTEPTARVDLSNVKEIPYTPDKWTVETAGSVTTGMFTMSKAYPLNKCSADQLTIVMEKSKDESERSAAAFLLKQMELGAVTA